MPELCNSMVMDRVRFAPDPQNKSHPTEPMFTASRLICRIDHFPEGVQYVSFHSVVASVVTDDDGKAFGVYSSEFNPSQTYFIFWGSRPDPLSLEGLSEIAVHPDLEGKVWVFGNARGVAEQAT